MTIRSFYQFIHHNRNRAFLRSVHILIPEFWSYPAYPAVKENIETAEIVIERPNPAYGDSPYTLQSGDCGDPGDHIHLTPWYVNHFQDQAEVLYGRAEKVMVHQWAKVRWGVYEEYGYPGDEKFPMFYLKTLWTSSGQTEVVKPNFCSNKELSGVSFDLETGGECSTDPLTGRPDSNCYFLPDQANTANSSYMALPFLESITDFCDSSEDLLHLDDIPTKQNLFCDGRSPWSVILENEDFANGSNEPVVILDEETVPEILVVKAERTKYVVVMDVSGSMDANPQTGLYRGGNMKEIFQITSHIQQIYNY